MTRDDIIRTAREAGLLDCDCCLPFWPEEDEENWKRFFVNFAALVAAAERTTPPRREWVGLTDDDLKPVCDEYRIIFGGWVHDFARAIEAKLKEKNQ